MTTKFPPSSDLARLVTREDGEIIIWCELCATGISSERRITALNDAICVWRDHQEHMKSSVLTWRDLLQKCSRLHSDDEHMLQIYIDPVALPGVVGRGGESFPVPATVVPTRMHEPGFYVRAIDGTPTWAYWLLRSGEDMEMFKRFVDQGLVRRYM